jgi:uncharacterized protein (DUF433 family)
MKNGTNPVVIETSRGPSIHGTRLTVYSILDDLNGGGVEFARAMYAHLLTEAEWDEVLQYIEAHRAELEVKLAAILRRSEEERRYWEERNQERLARPPSPPANERMAEARVRLAAWKLEQEQRRNGT